MKTVDMAKATAPLAKYAQNLRRDPVILTRKGRPVAALVSIKDVDWETITLSSDPKFLDLIQRARERQRVEGGLSSAEMRRRLGLKHAIRRRA